MNQAMTVVQTGVNLTAGASSTQGSIPLTSAGTLPRAVRIASNQPVAVKLGKTSVTAAAGDILVQPSDAVILAVGGNDVWACIQLGVGGIVNMVALENS